MAETQDTRASFTVRRRSQRILMQVPVGVRGIDSLGNDFTEETETLAISAHGALVLLTSRVTSGSKIILRHMRTQEEQECHVAFLGPVRSGRAEIGLEFAAPRASFWRVAFPPEDWSPKSPESRTVASKPKP